MSRTSVDPALGQTIPHSLEFCKRIRARSEFDHSYKGWHLTDAYDHSGCLFALLIAVPSCRGRKVKTSPVPIKDSYFATLKSNNYLPNVLAVIDAEAEGLDYVSQFNPTPYLNEARGSCFVFVRSALA